MPVMSDLAPLLYRARWLQFSLSGEVRSRRKRVGFDGHDELSGSLLAAPGGRYRADLVDEDGDRELLMEDNSSFPWLDEMIARGIRLDGDRLRPANEATTVRMRDGEVLLVDGPFAETKEAIVGYDVIECADLDEAIAVAAQHPVAEFGMIEVRPFWR